MGKIYPGPLATVEMPKALRPKGGGKTAVGEGTAVRMRPDPLPDDHSRVWSIAPVSSIGFISI